MYLNTAITGIINAAMKDLRDSVAQTSSQSYRWAIWSPTLVAAVAVDSGWTDITYDIQRRRGVKPQGKIAWS
jgi:hypothetical protein